MRAWRHAWALSLLLAGCATTPPMREPLDAAQQGERLLQLTSFSLAGKVGVEPQGFTASVEWQQQQSLAKVRLSGAIGGSMALEYSPTSLSVVTSRGDRVVDGDAEAFLVRELGLMPPFNVLRYWILGVPAPGIAADQTHDVAGLLLTLSQQDWLIRYERRMPVDTAAGRMQLPARVVVTSDGLRLTLVVKRWDIK